MRAVWFIGKFELLLNYTKYPNYSPKSRTPQQPQHVVGNAILTDIIQYNIVILAILRHMDKKDLINVFDNILKPKGFKRSGNYWRYYNDELEKIVNLQKSQWGNQYYINYGFNIADIQREGLSMHIFRRISSIDDNNKNILDFAIEIQGNRSQMVEKLLNDILIVFNEINSVTDIVNDLKKRSHLNDVPIKVKEYLGL